MQRKFRVISAITARILAVAAVAVAISASSGTSQTARTAAYTAPSHAARAAASTTALLTSSQAASMCAGAGGALNNVFDAALGILQPAILGEADLGTPYLDGKVVRVDSSLPFYSWGSCASQVVFRMQTKACGFWGCHWQTRSTSNPQFFWAHDDTGVISQQVAMNCRPGTNSYQVEMQVIGLSSSGDVSSETGEPEAISVEQDGETKDGPVVKLTC